MKIKSENLEFYLKNNKDKHNIFLFYGINFGLVDLLYEKTLDIFTVNINDPFSISKIDGNILKENPYVLRENISTISMFSDKRIILLDLNNIKIDKNIQDILLESIKEKNDYYIIIIKANNLGSKNILVKSVENSNNGLLIPCYEESNVVVQNNLSKLFSDFGISASKDFIRTLSTKFSSNTAINLMEFEKLKNFLLNNKIVSEKEIFTVIANNIDNNLNQIIMLSASGKVKEAIDLYEKSYENSYSSNFLIKLFVKHFSLIETILIKVNNGEILYDAINKIKPTIFFKDKPHLNFQCKIWNLNQVNLILKRLIEIEVKCKSNLLDDKIIMSHFILSTSVIARNASRI